MLPAGVPAWETALVWGDAFARTPVLHEALLGGSGGSGAKVREKKETPEAR